MKCLANLLIGALLLLVTVLPQWAHPKTYTTQRLNPAPPIIDGRLSDTAWGQVPWGDNFTQKAPYEGKKPSEQTRFKIMYDDKNLYVGIRAYDTKADKISRISSRRDDREGDWVEVILDSYFDRRTGFAFSVTAAGVKQDMLVSGDGDNWDDSWDPVWHVKTAVDDEGWTAEMCIPFSQLRFAGNDQQTWGLHVARHLYRKQELVEWNVIPRKAAGWVSLFGRLQGVEGIETKRRIELMPYTVAQHNRYPSEEGNPFADGVGSRVTLGLDGKMGLGSNLTLDFTVNPDFGQVEADPSQLNLSAFEVFFDEKRPFFIEGRNILSFGLNRGNGNHSMDNLFYSRRIGRAPHHYPDLEEGEYVDIPDNTTILAALKLTGKTRGGFSIGILNSITARESANIDLLGQQRGEVVEPLTNYFALRVQKDFNRGKTIIGGMVTSVLRDLSKDPQLNFLHRAAYSGGLDIYHSWKNRQWYVTLSSVFSHVRGDSEAILQTQQSSRRYYQRPDADYVNLDPNRTSLSGHGGSLAFGKSGGGRLRFSTGLTWRSPGLELNDIGFLRSADRLWQHVWASYRITEPFAIFRSLNFSFNQGLWWTYGGDYMDGRINAGAHARFKNYWGVSTGVRRSMREVSITELRGGPSLKMPGGWNRWIELRSDSRKKLQFEVGASLNTGDHGSQKRQRYWTGIVFQPLGALRLSLSPGYTDIKNQLQYVTTLESGGDTRYVFASIHRKTLSLSMRLNYSITPDLSIQFYGQPYISTGQYDRFKYITDPRAGSYEDRFHLYDGEEIRYNTADEAYQIAEAGGHEYSFDAPDFKFLEFRFNLVLRWEYAAGSTLYVVWSQGRSEYLTGDTDFSFSRGFSDLMNSKPNNVFLVKFTYRFKL